VSGKPWARPARFENLVVTDAFDAHTARRIDGEMVVPLYLDQPGTGSLLQIGANGLPLPGTPTHEVLMIAALGDHQVNTLGAHIMARAVGAKLIRPAVGEIFELETVDPPHRGSALVEFDFGNVPDPVTNVPPREGRDPHGHAAEVPAAAPSWIISSRPGKPGTSATESVIGTEP
jgi:hypothetical protein